MDQSVQFEDFHCPAIFDGVKYPDAEVAALAQAFGFEISIGVGEPGQHHEKAEWGHAADAGRPQVSECRGHRHQHNGDDCQCQPATDPLDEYETGYESSKDGPGVGDGEDLSNHVPGAGQVPQSELDDHWRHHSEDQAGQEEQ